MPELDLQSRFPRWRSVSRLPADLWTLPCPLRTHDNFAAVLTVIDADQRSALQVSSAGLYRLSSAIVEDLLDLQRSANAAETRTILQYLQFEVSAHSLYVAINQGEYGSAYDWINNAVDDTVSTAVEREFNTERFVTLLTTDIDWIVSNRSICFLQWFANFYYYCRSMAALHPLANDLMPALLHVLTPPWQDMGIAIRAIVFALNWATGCRHACEQNLAELAEACIEDRRVNSELKAWIAISFLTEAARFTRRSPQEWAQWALQNLEDALSPNDTLQALIALVLTPADWDAHRAAVLEAIDASVAAQLVRFPCRTALIQRIERGIKMLDPLIFKMHAFGKSDALLEVFCHWYGVPPAIRHRGPALICLPNHGQGTAFIGSQSSLMPFLEPNAIETLTRQTNEALGTTYTLAGQRVYDALRDRPGTPDYDLSPQFERVLQGHYRWEEVNPAEYDAARTVVFCPGYPHPHQALMLASVGRCLPISSSLEEPMEDKVIRRVAIWASGNDQYSLIEADAVASILRAANIACDCLSGQEHCKADFLAHYSSFEYDVFWVAGHGQYDRWDPTSPSILVGEDSAISIDELLELDFAQNSPGRRLLVLNICDSAAAATFGGIHKLGLAPMLASQAQAVIGHIWPVDPLIAAGMGVQLARELVRHQRDFFAAFQAALSSLRMPWPAFTEDAARNLDCEIFQRMRNNERDLANIFHWGSACFFA